MVKIANSEPNVDIKTLHANLIIPKGVKAKAKFNFNRIKFNQHKR